MASREQSPDQQRFEVVVTQEIRVVHHVSATSERQARYLVLSKLHDLRIKFVPDSVEVRPCQK